MKKIILIISLLFLGIMLAAQVEEETKTYSFLQEDFNNNSNSWEIYNNENGQVKIADGMLYLDSKKENQGQWAVNKNLVLNLQKDWVIAADVKHYSGTNEWGYGIVFGARDYNNFWGFEISDTGYYQVYKFEAGTMSKLQDWTKISFIKPNELNMLRIYKINKVLYFTINDVYVKQLESTDFPGREIGLQVSSIQKIACDKFIVRQATDNDLQTLANKAKALEQKENTNHQDNYRSQFQAAFKKVIAAASNNFADIYYEDRYVQDDDRLHELKVHFPEEYEYTFYRSDLYFPSGTDYPPTVQHLVQVDYNTEDENSPLADYGITTNDEDEMRACYEKLINELRQIRYDNIADGDWQEVESSKYIFMMVSTTDKFPQVTVAIEIGNILGVKLRFMLEE